MPYIDGRRVSNAEWTERYGSLAKLHTGPNGENPADAPELDPETKAPKSKPGKRRGVNTGKKRTAAIADAMGVSTETLPDITGLDAGTEDNSDNA